jgi:hypothetical protein
MLNSVVQATLRARTTDECPTAQRGGAGAGAGWTAREAHRDFAPPSVSFEPGHVLGEEATAGGQARYVDSSVERLQVKAEGFLEARYKILCSGFELPMHPT